MQLKIARYIMSARNVAKSYGFKWNAEPCSGDKKKGREKNEERWEMQRGGEMQDDLGARRTRDELRVRDDESSICSFILHQLTRLPSISELQCVRPRLAS